MVATSPQLLVRYRSLSIQTPAPIPGQDQHPEQEGPRGGRRWLRHDRQAHIGQKRKRRLTRGRAIGQEVEGFRFRITTAGGSEIERLQHPAGKAMADIGHRRYGLASG